MKEGFSIIRPCPGDRISSHYGPREVGDKFHDGLDYLPLKPYTEGDEILAAQDGIVVASYKSKSYGHMVILDHPIYNASTVYAHLKESGSNLGVNVKQGDKIGYMGRTGNATGVHLHFEVRDRTYKGNEAEYWATHTKNGGNEFYSSQDPLKFIIDQSQESTYKAQLESILSNMRALCDDMDTIIRHF